MNNHYPFKYIYSDLQFLDSEVYYLFSLFVVDNNLTRKFIIYFPKKLINYIIYQDIQEELIISYFILNFKFTILFNNFPYAYLYPLDKQSLSKISLLLGIVHNSYKSSNSVLQDMSSKHYKN